MDAIKKTVEDLEKFKWPIGNLALLQVQEICNICMYIYFLCDLCVRLVVFTIMQYIYWEKVEPIGVDTFDPLSREYPLMVNWPETEGKKRDDYDNMHGRGTGNVSQ